MNQEDDVPQQFLISQDHAERTRTPIGEVIDVFPAAFEEIAVLLRSKNYDGLPLIWVRKGDDHNQLIRHFIERGGIDGEGVRHSAAMAVRALSILQAEMELERGRKTPARVIKNER